MSYMDDLDMSPICPLGEDDPVLVEQKASRFFRSVGRTMPVTHWTSSTGAKSPIKDMSTWHLICTVAMIWRCESAYRRGITPIGDAGKVVQRIANAEEIMRAMMAEIKRRDEVAS